MSTPPNHASRPIPRRTLVKGTAWATPALAAAVAAPALAASPAVVMSHLTRFRWYDNTSPRCTGGNSIDLNSSVSGTGVSFSTTTSTTQITNVGVYFWNARNDIQFVAIAGNSGCWTVPRLDGVTTVSGGITYYRYASVYTCPIAPLPGTTTLQPYAWSSQCYYYPYGSATWYRARTMRRQAFATVNGQVQSTDTGFFVPQAG